MYTHSESAYQAPTLRSFDDNPFVSPRLDDSLGLQLLCGSCGTGA